MWSSGESNKNERGGERMPIKMARMLLISFFVMLSFRFYRSGGHHLYEAVAWSSWSAPSATRQARRRRRRQKLVGCWDLPSPPFGTSRSLKALGEKRPFCVAQAQILSASTFRIERQRWDDSDKARRSKLYLRFSPSGQKGHLHSFSAFPPVLWYYCASAFANDQAR